MATHSLLTELMKTQLLMNLTSRDTPMRNFFMFQMYETFIQNIPKFLPTIKTFCCSRRNRTVASMIQQQSQKINATISCERVFQSSSAKSSNSTLGNHSRMDSVIHYITTLPSVKNLLSITHHDYMPHDFEPIQIESDIYFELQDLKHNDGQVEIVKFKLFCYEHPIQHLQQQRAKWRKKKKKRMMMEGRY